MNWGGGGKQLDTILGNCVKNKMLPIIELHYATRKWDKFNECVEGSNIKNAHCAVLEFTYLCSKKSVVIRIKRNR